MKQHFKNFEDLSTKEKIGQLFFIGISGSTLSKDDEKLLGEIKPGGVCLFSRNIKDPEETRELLEEIRRRSFFEPFLSLDQEGGLVDRLRRVVEPFPSANDLSQKGNSDLIAAFARLTSEIIRILGFNMNFAPVIDAFEKNRRNFVMGIQQRNFGGSKEEIFQNTKIYLENLQSSGVIGCLKHFPGIGGVESDPHDELPSVRISEKEFFETDIFPFSEHFAQSEIHAVMTGHVTFPLLDLQETDSDGKLLPASLSQNFITGLLRKRLGYENLILSDDLEMGAILKNYPISFAARSAFEAGTDFLLICNQPEAVREAFEELVRASEQGLISDARIRQSFERIQRVRQRLSSPLEFSLPRLAQLSTELRELKNSL